MGKTKVLVVDDSAFMRKVITDMINKDDELEVVGTARNGEDAILKLNNLKPDVITMDVEMPKMSGLEALEKIMGIRPTPVIMLSTLTQAGADITINALSKGAIDFVQKPGGAISLNIQEVQHEIIKKIKIARKANILNKSPVKSTVKPVLKPESQLKYLNKNNCMLDFPIIVIGTSTGGPKALHKVIEGLPGEIRAGILIVQHMPPGFTKSLAQRLDNLTTLKVKEAEDNDRIYPGYVYIAPGNYHMEFKIYDCKPLIKLNQHPPVNGHRPSVDTLFNSVAQAGLKKVIAVIMTGMGYDGKDGIKNLKNNGCITIAESEETCVVYGMPKSAVETGCIDKIVPLYNIASEIITILNNMN